MRLNKEDQFSDQARFLEKKRTPSYFIILFLTFVLFFTSLACELSSTGNWTQTLMADTPTPAISPTINPDDLGKISVMVDRKELKISLDPLGERDTSSVNVNIVEFTNAYLVETFDPNGNYLPSVNFLVKDREPVQEISATQKGSSWQWGFELIDNLDASLLQTNLLGTVSLGSVHQMTALQGITNGVNFVLPADISADENQMVYVYRSPGNNSVLLLPEGYASLGTAKLASFRLQSEEEKRFAVFSFIAMPVAPLSGYIRMVQNVEVSDYLGVSIADYHWAELKVLESRDGLPLDYVRPSGISEDIINWLNYDQGLRLSLYYLNSQEEAVYCTNKDEEEMILDQSPVAGRTLNALIDPITLYVCNEVVSKSKYETLTFTTDTPTVTNTPLPTLTASLTPTITPTGSLVPSSTVKPSSTSRPSATVKPSSTNTTAPTTAASNTAVPSSTSAPSVTPTITNTPTPDIFDDFITSPNGYNTTVWSSPVDSGSFVRSWPREDRLHQEVNATGSMQLITQKSCLWGEAEFKILSSESGDGIFMVGFSDSAISNGVILQSDPADSNDTQLLFSVISGGVVLSSQNVTVSTTTAAFHTYRIVWAANDEISIKADLYIDSATSPYVSIIAGNVENRLKFMLYNEVVSSGTSWIEIDYVKVESDSCQ